MSKPATKLKVVPSRAEVQSKLMAAEAEFLMDSGWQPHVLYREGMDQSLVRFKCPFEPELLLPRAAAVRYQLKMDNNGGLNTWEF
jgi:hypothetical protein